MKCQIVAPLRLSGAGRTPHGVRGLKLEHLAHERLVPASHPARGAWIEIGKNTPGPERVKSHPARGAWIEIQN